MHTCVYSPVPKIPFLRNLTKSGMQPLSQSKGHQPHGPFTTIAKLCVTKMSIEACDTTDALKPGEGQWVTFIISSAPQSTPRDRMRRRENLSNTIPRPHTRHTESKTGHGPSTVVFNSPPGGSEAQSSLRTTVASQGANHRHACEWGKEKTLKTMED